MTWLLSQRNPLQESPPSPVNNSLYSYRSFYFTTYELHIMFLCLNRMLIIVEHDVGYLAGGGMFYLNSCGCLAIGRRGED